MMTDSDKIRAKRLLTYTEKTQKYIDQEYIQQYQQYQEQYLMN